MSEFKKSDDCKEQLAFADKKCVAVYVLLKASLICNFGFKKTVKDNVLTLVRLGSHSELF